MKQKQKITAVVIAVLFLFPALFLKANGGNEATEVPTYGDVPRDVVLDENVVPGHQPFILRDSVFYLKNDNGYPALLKKPIAGGEATKIADRILGDISYNYNYNSYTPEGQEVGVKTVFYSKYSDEINGYDLFLYDLRTDTEHLVLSKPGDQIKPKGSFDGFSADVIYLDKLSDTNGNISHAYSNFDYSSDEIYVSEVSLDTDFDIRAGASYVYYELNNDLMLYTVSDQTNVLFKENARNPFVSSISEMSYERQGTESSDVYVYNFDFEVEFPIANTSAEETHPVKSQSGEYSYLLGTPTGHSVEMKKFTYNGDGVLDSFESFSVSNGTYSNNINQHFFNGYFVWLGDNGGQTDLVSFDSGLYNRYLVSVSGDWTVWYDGLDWAGPRLNVYNSVSKEKRVIAPPEGKKFDYQFKLSGENLILTVTNLFNADNLYNDMYKYNFDSKTLTKLTPADNNNKSYGMFGISRGKIYYNSYQFAGHESTYLGMFTMDIETGITEQFTVLSEFQTLSIDCVADDYITFMEDLGNFKYNLKMVKLDTNEIVTIADGYSSPSDRGLFFTASYIGSGKVTWSDSINIYAYDIATAKVEKVEFTPDKIYRYKPKYENGVLVWQEYELTNQGNVMGLNNQNILKTVFAIPKAQAAAYDKVVAYSLSAKQVLASFVLNQNGSDTNTYLAGTTLYYDDVQNNGLKSIYSVTLNPSTLAALNRVLPKTGLAAISVIGVGLLGGTGYTLATRKRKRKLGM